MTLFDLLLLAALTGFVASLRAVARYAEQRREARARDCDAFEGWADVLRSMQTAWNEPEPPRSQPQLVMTVDLAPLVGEVLHFEEDALGRWFPGQHEPESPVLFDDLRSAWTSPLDHTWKPAWASPTGAWAAVTVRQELSTVGEMQR